ncbi:MULTISPECIES: sugar phosphate isomerase/epimerase family protein [unclassified Dysgonomonas]|uniref:sugar phosphate isomerase/epimerase family protein n=1 Tax=unclassified Dysgonomonas TaxID=2630389 RepID=UPI0013E9D62F|nr:MULTISPECIES: sugar phosphate isomerase/epimerase family protein [unclassified Dysgonomonas]
MNPQLGATTLSWIHPLWNDEAGLYAIKKASDIGFDLIELLLPHSMVIDTNSVRKQLDRYNIDAVCGLNLSADTHIPTHPKEALQLIKKALDKVAELELNHLGGVLHSGIGSFSGNVCTESEKQTICDVWAEVADYAQQYGVNIGVEPINRYESYICNTGENVLELLKRLDVSNMYLHLDTFHMNIEEDNFYDPIISAGDRLKHVHMTESNRGMLGEGNVHWADLFKALKEIDYTGNLVLENFSSSVEGMSSAVSLWQRSKYDADDLAKGSLEFIRKMIALT